MNALTLIALLASASGAPAAFAEAQPQNLYCHSKDVMDAGYIFKLANDRSSAILEEQTFAGPRPVADMACEKLPVPRNPDAIENTVLCRADRMGGGIFVRLFEGGKYFQQYATVTNFSVTRDGVIEEAVQFGDLTCSQE